MLQLASCERCLMLLAQEHRLRASYEAAIKSLYDFGIRSKADKYERDRMLADDTWDSLMQAVRERQKHQREHLVEGDVASRLNKKLNSIATLRIRLLYPLVPDRVFFSAVQCVRNMFTPVSLPAHLRGIPADWGAGTHE